MGVIEVVKKQEREKGIEQGKRQVIEGIILKKLGLSDKEITEIAKVTVDAVRKIREDLVSKRQPCYEIVRLPLYAT